MALRRFYIPPKKVHTHHPEITGSDAGHIFRVLRLSVNDDVELFDGSGKGYRAKIKSVSPKRIRLRIVDDFPLLAESPIQITIAQAFLKNRKMEALIQPLTELGIHRWMPFYAARSVPVPDKKRLEKRLSRWDKIALEAVKQCRRGRIPRIEPATCLDGILTESDNTAIKIIFHAEETQRFDGQATVSEKPESVMVLVGPEGGFTPEEVAMAKAHGFLPAGMGPRILRSQTAAIAACTLVQYIYGDMGIK